MKFPFYLAKRLANLGDQVSNLTANQAYLELFSQLKQQEPSLGFQALFDLYSIICGLPQPLSAECKQQLIAQYRNLPPRHPNLSPDIINRYMASAVEEALKALAADEVPIGAVIVANDQIIGRGYNQTKRQNNILAHAEIIALNEAQLHRGTHRLTNCDMYITLEPCLMCSGAILHSRLRRLIYAVAETKTGACISQYQVFNNKQVNHHCQVVGPVDPSLSYLVQEFFQTKR
jgi:tRNA(Arg) A34 adenosine deaminase TadA